MYFFSFPFSLCVHPDGVTVASGQVKGHGDKAKVIVCRCPSLLITC